MNIKLFFNLVFGVFSLNPKNMRWFNLKRIFVSLLILPVFITLLLVNHFFLTIDHIIFPSFKKVKIKNPVFIISAPRSATSFLYHSLSGLQSSFSSFKLWELIFAPSICQKFFFLTLIKLDRVFYSPIKKSVLFIENLFIKNIKKVHKIGLNIPEEDEAILLWNLSTVHLNFFYPDSHFFDDLFEFDNLLSKKRKQKIMRIYLAYIKRHNYVFNDGGEKTFLSKNPLMMSKMESIKRYFEDARIIMINRCPNKTISSTINLNKKLYSLFTSINTTPEVDERTINLLIKWYQMSYEKINLFSKDNLIILDFQKLVYQDKLQLGELCNFLSLDLSQQEKLKKEMSSQKSNVSQSPYTLMEQKKLDEVLTQIPFMKKYCS